MFQPDNYSGNSPRPLSGPVGDLQRLVFQTNVTAVNLLIWLHLLDGNMLQDTAVRVLLLSVQLAANSQVFIGVLFREPGYLCSLEAHLCSRCFPGASTHTLICVWCLCWYSSNRNTHYTTTLSGSGGSQSQFCSVLSPQGSDEVKMIC